MTRRAFLVLFAGSAVVWPLVAPAQQPAPRRIGVLSALSPSAVTSPGFDEFRKTLSSLGYEDGYSISLEYRWADGDAARLALFAAELVNLQVDVIFCGPG